MNAKEWLSKLSDLTGLPHYKDHKIFGDKNGVLIGTRDGYVVALGLGKANNSSAVHLLLRYGKTETPQQVQQTLKAAKGKFSDPKAEGTTAKLVRTYSLGKPNPENVAEDVQKLIDALKTAAPPMAGKCEECQRAESQIVLFNNLPGHFCTSCQAQISQKLDAAAIEYENLETNLPLGLLYGLVAALLGSIAWGGVAYLLNRIFLWGAVIIGLFVGKAVVMGTGKVTWTARGIIGVLTAASVAFGDAIFYALSVMKHESVSFMIALKAVLANFWKIETDADGGLISIIFGLIGAVIVMYSTRKPEFKARFVPLGSPELAASGAAAGK